jgi:hypothetical protein
MKFKVGDRVRVYYKGNLSFDGEITDISTYGLFVVEDGFYSSHKDSPFHSKQCRKIDRWLGRWLMNKKDVDKIYERIERLSNLFKYDLNRLETRLDDRIENLEQWKKEFPAIAGILNVELDNWQKNVKERLEGLERIIERERLLFELHVQPFEVRLEKNEKAIEALLEQIPEEIEARIREKSK